MVAGSGTTSVLLLAAGASLLIDAGASVDAFSASVRASVLGVEASVATVLPLGTARLGLRKRPPNFDDFLPSPSVPSASDVASVFRSFLVPRLLKKDVRRAGFVPSGAVGDVVASVACVDGSTVVSAGPVVVSAVDGLTVSSLWGAVEEATAASESLTGTAGAVSVEGLAGLAVSFLLKKLPKIEVLLPGLGAVSRFVFPVTGWVGDVAAGSAIVLVAPVAAVSPLVIPVGAVAAGSEVPVGSTGDPITRAATIC